MRGLVLAGGLSSRFGSDKAAAVYRGESFLRRAVRMLEVLNLPVLIMTRQGACVDASGAEVQVDDVPQKGPLGGIYSAMRRYPGEDFLVLTCDMPLLTAKTLAHLRKEHEINAAATFYRSSGEGVEPFPGIYPAHLWQVVSKAVSEERLSMHSLLDSIVEKNILCPDEHLHEFFNVNNPSEHKRIDP